MDFTGEGRPDNGEGPVLTSGMGARAALGIGEARGEQCGVVDRAMGESVRVDTGILAL